MTAEHGTPSEREQSPESRIAQLENKVSQLTKILFLLVPLSTDISAGKEAEKRGDEKTRLFNLMQELNAMSITINEK